MMPWWADLIVSAAAALLLLWLALIIALWRSGRGRDGLTDAARILPDVLRLITRLARDQTLPFSARLRLWLLLAYLASPLDLIPDFIPVVGYADDAIIVALALRSVVRTAGPDPLQQHWPGSTDGLTVVRRLAGIKDQRQAPSRGGIREVQPDGADDHQPDRDQLQRRDRLAQHDHADHRSTSGS